MQNIKKIIALLPLLPATGVVVASETKPSKPNVIFILVDDQGKGDFSCYGNPWVKTPNIDKLYSSSLRMENYHSSPLSSPARAAIITGRYPIRNGEWATYKGRDIVSTKMPKMAEIFSDNGYATAMFGKWHLGDCYPCRPIDCGFDYAVNHKSGGVGELSDYWGNSYFDDVYSVNETPVQFSGYCTDVWFDQAINYIEGQRNGDKPFFVYLATNAVHSPLYVAEKYVSQFRDKEGVSYRDAEYFAMVSNFDENYGRLEEYLKENGLTENTIVVFTTDNGSADGTDGERYGYNLGMRGKKTMHYEGGHTVPMFIRWMDGGLCSGEVRNSLTTHVDLVPTLASLLDLKLPKGAEFDGVDMSQVLTEGDDKADTERIVFIHNRQDSKPPFPEKGSCILYKNWSMVNGNELYDLDSDPFQENNVYREHSDVVSHIKAENNKFIEESKKFPEYQDFIRPIIGSEHEKVTTLTIQHAIGSGVGFWKSEQVCEGLKSTNDTYALEVEKSATYQISCARWPRECSAPIWGTPTYNPKNFYTYSEIHPESATITINGKEYTHNIKESDKEVTFDVKLKKGKLDLSTNFVENGKKYGVYYIYISLKE